MKKQRIKIYNGKIITPERIIDNGTIVITGNNITAVAGSDIDVADALEINAGGNYISPGFIDIHVHGGGGYDFMDANTRKYIRCPPPQV